MELMPTFHPDRCELHVSGMVRAADLARLAHLIDVARHYYCYDLVRLDLRHARLSRRARRDLRQHCAAWAMARLRVEVGGREPTLGEHVDEQGEARLQANGALGTGRRRIGFGGR